MNQMSRYLRPAAFFVLIFLVPLATYELVAEDSGLNWGVSDLLPWLKRRWRKHHGEKS